jgi:uncharacterized membrane protein YjdF
MVQPQLHPSSAWRNYRVGQLGAEQLGTQRTQTKPRQNCADLAVAIMATVVMILLSLMAPAGSTYRFAFLFLSACLWAVFAVRRRLHLQTWHLALLASALLLHNLGVFGFYRREFWSLQFDTYVHFYFGWVGGFLLSAFLENGYRVRGWRLVIALTVGILGLGGIHELIEWASTMALGPERGMLKALGDDPYDTQKDLMNNLLGAWLALACLTTARKLKR